MEGYILEIKFKPEPEKKDTGAGTSPEEKTAGTEENVSAAEIAEQTAETAGTEEPEAEKLTEKSVGIKRRRRSKKSPVTDSEINGEDGAAGVGKSDRPEESHSGKSGGSRDMGGTEGFENSGEDAIVETVGEAVEKKPMRLWQKILLGAGAVVLAVMLTFGFSIWREYSLTEST